MSEPADPTRFSQDASAGSLRDWMRQGELDLPSDEQLAHLANRLEPTFATPVGGVTSPLAASVPKLLLGALGIAGIAALAFSLRGTHGEAPKTTVAPAALSTATPTEVPKAASPELAPSASTGSAPEEAAEVPSAAHSARANGAKAAPSEAALLEQARSALATDPARALALTRQHQARFPSGVLKQEREVIAIEALRRLGRSQAASERAGSFERDFPDSAHRRAVESGLSK